MLHAWHGTALGQMTCLTILRLYTNYQDDEFIFAQSLSRLAGHFIVMLDKAS